MGKWFIYAVLALVVIGFAAFAQTEQEPASTEKAIDAPQALIHGDHLIVLQGSVINIYDLNQLPDMALVNAIDVPDSVDEATVLLTATNRTARAKAGIPCPSATDTQTEYGKKVYDSLDCAKCHRINGKGGTAGSDLTHVGSRRTEEYIEKKITDPKATNKNSIMPPHKLPQKDLEALGKYLAGLK